MKVHKATDVCYFIAHDPSVHYGQLEANQEIATGQANLEIFDNEEDYNARLLEFGIVVQDNLNIEVKNDIS